MGLKSICCVLWKMISKNCSQFKGITLLYCFSEFSFYKICRRHTDAPVYSFLCFVSLHYIYSKTALLHWPNLGLGAYYRKHIDVCFLRFFSYWLREYFQSCLSERSRIIAELCIILYIFREQTNGRISV